MRRFLRENSLGLAFGTLFLGTLVVQAFVGHADFNADQAAHHGDPIGLWRYVTSSSFGVDVLENWQSEFLAIGSMACWPSTCASAARRNPSPSAHRTRPPASRADPPRYDLPAAALPPLRPAAFFCCVVPPWLLSLSLAEPDARERILRADPADWAAAWRAFTTLDVQGRLAELDAPALIMVGEEDASTTPEIMTSIARRIPGSTLQVLRATPHMQTLEQPTLVAEALTRFLR